MCLGSQFGRNLVWVEGDLHRRQPLSFTYRDWVLTSFRQRKFLLPAFSNAAIRDLTHVFYDSAHRVHI